MKTGVEAGRRRREMPSKAGAILQLHLDVKRVLLSVLLQYVGGMRTRLRATACERSLSDNRAVESVQASNQATQCVAVRLVIRFHQMKHAPQGCPCGAAC